MNSINTEDNVKIFSGNTRGFYSGSPGTGGGGGSSGSGSRALSRPASVSVHVRAHTHRKKIFHNKMYDVPFSELEHCQKFNTDVWCNYSAHDSELEARFDSMCNFLNKTTDTRDNYSINLFAKQENKLNTNINTVFTENEIISKVKLSHRKNLLSRNYIGIEREKQLNRMLFFLNIYKLKTAKASDNSIFEKNLFTSREDKQEYLMLVNSLIHNIDLESFLPGNCLNTEDVTDIEDGLLPGSGSEEEYFDPDYYEPLIYEEPPKDLFCDCLSEIYDGNLLIESCEDAYCGDNFICMNNAEMLEYKESYKEENIEEVNANPEETKIYPFEEILKTPDYTSEFDLDERKIPNYISGFYELSEDFLNIRNITHENDKLYQTHIRNTNEFEKPKFFCNIDKYAKEEKAELIADKMLEDLVDRNLSINEDPKKRLCEADKIMSEARMLRIV